ncbi:MAG: peptidoglycan-binding protein [Eubacteriales bacterium]
MIDFDMQAIEEMNTKSNLKIAVIAIAKFLPIVGAKVTLTKTEDEEDFKSEQMTNESGQVEFFDLQAPNIAFSLEPSEVKPYAEYTVEVEANGYETALVEGVQILADTLGLLQVNMLENSEIDSSINSENAELNEDREEGGEAVPFIVTAPSVMESIETMVDSNIEVLEEEEVIVIPEHTLYGEYPPKIPEAQVKPVEESGEIVLSRVVIPEYIIVHDGLPTNRSAKNYYVKYKDYIKNVASSEIYATWPEATLYANILAIMSFTLNRVYTEWYRAKGYDFTITSSTAFDQKWIYGRNIFENIDYLVDTVFANYLSKPGIKQPIFTSYCDGQRVNCSGLSQWGSKSLGEEGYSAIEILRYYYGNDIYINTADAISGVPSSWPGYVLTIGSSGQKVQQVQEQLNRISRNFPAIPSITSDGIYGQMTAEAVKVFQRVFNLPVTGEIDYPTWYEISNIFVGVSRISEPE